MTNAIGAVQAFGFGKPIKSKAPTEQHVAYPDRVTVSKPRRPKLFPFNTIYVDHKVGARIKLMLATKTAHLIIGVQNYHVLFQIAKDNADIKTADYRRFGRFTLTVLKTYAGMSTKVW